MENPGEIIINLKDTRKEFVEKIKEFKKFEVHYKKIQEIARAQPEMFISFLLFINICIFKVGVFSASGIII